jgi:hypothetical protein
LHLWRWFYFYFSSLSFSKKKKKEKIPTLHGSSACRDPFCHRPLVFITTQLNVVICSLSWTLHRFIFS